VFYPEELEGKGEGFLASLIYDAAFRRMRSFSRVDVAVVGAGPAGLTASWILAEKGFSVVVLERTLGVGGGIRGGSMLLPAALLEEGEAADIARRLGVRLREASENLYSVDPVELTLKLAVKAVDSGAAIWPGIHVEDLVTEGRGSSLRVKGILINLTPIIISGMHVDPIYMEAKAVIDATGHDAYVARILAKRHPELGLKVPGMASQNAWLGEREVVEKTGMIVPGLYAAGMSVAEIHNTHRMGPLIGGMLVSGKKAAEIIAEDMRGG